MLKLLLIFSGLLSFQILKAEVSDKIKLETSRYSRSHLFAPRQRITVSGHIKNKKSYKFKTDTFEQKFKFQSVTINDLYNVNQKTKFEGPSLKDITEFYALEDYTKVKIKTFDGYVVEIPKDKVNEDSLILATKDDLGYLSVDRMGPIRIVGQFKGNYNKKIDIVETIYWAWQVMELEYIK